MESKVKTASTVNLETIAQIYCSWLPDSIADLMYKDIVQKELPPEELAGIFGLSKEECIRLLEGKTVRLLHPIFAHGVTYTVNLN